MELAAAAFSGRPQPYTSVLLPRKVEPGPAGEPRVLSNVLSGSRGGRKCGPSPSQGGVETVPA